MLLTMQHAESWLPKTLDLLLDVYQRRVAFKSAIIIIIEEFVFITTLQHYTSGRGALCQEDISFYMTQRDLTAQREMISRRVVESKLKKGPQNYKGQQHTMRGKWKQIFISVCRRDP